MLRQKPFLGVLSLVFLSLTSAQAIRAQEPALGECEPPSKELVAPCRMLLYYSGEPEMTSCYEHTLSGLVENESIILSETDDAGYFEEQLTSGRFDVMLALTTDREAAALWRAARAPIPTLATCTPNDAGKYELELTYYAVFSSDSLLYEPAGDASIDQTAPGEYYDETMSLDDMRWGLPDWSGIWKKIQIWWAEARAFMSKVLGEIAKILEKEGEAIKVKATIHIGEPTKSFWCEITITGDGKRVAKILEAYSKIIKPKK